MKNAVCLIFVVAVGGIIFLQQRSVFIRARASTTQLRAQVDSLGDQLDGLEKTQAELKRSLSEILRTLFTNRVVNAPGSVVPPDPERNGGWPTDAPYFYLPKQDLPRVKLASFMTNAPIVLGPNERMMRLSAPWTNQLSDDGAILLGMTPAERAGVDEAYLRLWERLRKLGLAKVERIAPEPGWSIPVVSEYHIPRLTNEVDTILSELKSTFSPILGTVRASHFVDGPAGGYIREGLRRAAEREYFIVFGPNRLPDGEVQSQISYSLGSSFGGGEPLKKDPYLTWFFGDTPPKPNP